MVKQTVTDYEAWKTVFDEHGGTRKRFGSKGCQIFRASDSPNQITVLTE